MAIDTVAVLGCGLMGSGIAEVSARAGFATIVREIDDEALANGFRRTEASLERAEERGKLTAQERQSARQKLSGTTDLADLAAADLVIEAIVENLDLKQEIFSTLDDICSSETIFASNTSSLTITEIAASTRHPERMVGLHFFNPVPVMPLVEVVRTLMNGDRVIETATDFSRALGKEPIACRDNSGFIVNRLLVPYLLDAIRAYEEGVGSIEDIDTGMRLGASHPMGPFQLIDFVGLDTAYHIANIMFAEYREKRFAPPPLLKQMVAAGRLGRKSGRGFYDYSETD